MVRPIALLWLTFLIFPYATYISAPHPLAVHVAVWAAMAVFLVLYVLAHHVFPRLSAWHPRWAWLGWAWTWVMLIAFYPVFHLSGLGFVIYGLSMIGYQRDTRVLVALTAFGVGTMLFAFARTPHTPDDLLWFLPNIFIAVFSPYASHAAYRRDAAQRRLQIVQAEKERLAQQAERERISRDLHDLLGHTLSVIALKSELAGKLAGRDPARAAQEITDVARISRDALQEVRAAVRGYRGSGLTAELARAKIALDTAGVTLDLDTDAPDLPPATEYAMELVLREAITNVVRHAGASRVQVSVTGDADAFTLRITDDGRGMRGAEGTGLTGMRERVRAHGGTLSCAPGERGAGTRLTAVFPLATAPRGVPLTPTLGSA
ncbi:sensor histidine kinase [Deinococcus maricopensis]|uniref:Integral membrane sensor signal transduction histidine kinase n=1 Tax=Deinococcus maricopensis (strain DSM 21211 / LMG 22137 / NRRL B-23946 / LB-34) TaxID=709986 RepID=E8U6L6_DEIML|nr:sensor histidine kinase [Deinococcus maricopensis]ADV66705.1 integral membrane sensor signal transduction histidine kinase [Deinococcus maricopensis DSM 21211]